MKYLLILSLFLTGCVTPSYTTSHGIKVFDNTTHISPTKEEVELVTEYIAKELGGLHKLRGTKLMLVSSWIHVPQPNGHVILMDGITDIEYKEVIASVFQTCFADSGAVHELAHVIHDYDSKIPDWFHDDKMFWQKIKWVEERIIEVLCPPDYQRKEIGPDYVPPPKK